MAEHQVAADLDADRRSFFAAAGEGFRRAAKVTGVIERDFMVGGGRVRLRFAGPALMPHIVPALAHLETERGASPDLTVALFDSRSTSVPLPLLASSLVDLIRLRWWERLERRREIRGYHGGSIKAVFHLGPNILSLLDLQAQQAVYWIENAEDIPYYERGYPLTTLLNWWLGERGRLFVHAATLGNADAAVLVPGSGGSGKSTTTLACARSSLRVLGDDYAVVEPLSLTVHSLFNTVKLKGWEDLERFASFRPWVSNLDRVGDGENQEKAMIFLHEHLPEIMLTTSTLVAVLLPRVTGRPETTIEPSSPGAALRGLAPSTMFQLAGNEREAFRALAMIAKELPTFEIRLGTDLATIPAAIDRFLHAIPGRR